MTPRTSEPVALNTQNLQAVREIGANPALQLRSRTSHATLFAELRARGFDNFYRVYENFTVVRTGIYVGHEEATLARAAQSAIVWSHKQAPQIYFDSFGAGATVVSQKPELTYTIGSAPNPRLRVIKLASTPVAEPGDEVSFTIRFDNVGNQPIGSVQIVDSLTTRLEYVPGSAQCSLNAQFSTQPNEGESLVVRCVLGDPLPAGKRRRLPLPLYRAISPTFGTDAKWARILSHVIPERLRPSCSQMTRMGYNGAFGNFRSIFRCFVAMAKSKKKSETVFLVCKESGEHNYTLKRKPGGEKLALQKYCPTCRKHTEHNEKKK